MAAQRRVAGGLVSDAPADPAHDPVAVITSGPTTGTTDASRVSHRSHDGDPSTTGGGAGGTGGPDGEGGATDHGPETTVPTWEEIAERYGDTVFTMAFRLTGDPDEARDLAQDVFVRVYRNLDRYRPGTFEGWLYRITKNLFLDRVRRRTRVRLEPLPDEEWRQPRDHGPGPAERAEEGVLRDDLEVALDDLTPTFRTAVVMCDVQGLSYEEISAATGWPIGTVRSRIHRGRKELRGHLASRRSRRG